MLIPIRFGDLSFFPTSRRYSFCFCHLPKNPARSRLYCCQFQKTFQKPESLSLEKKGTGDWGAKIATYRVCGLLCFHSNPKSAKIYAIVTEIAPEFWEFYADHKRRTRRYSSLDVKGTIRQKGDIYYS